MAVRTLQPASAANVKPSAGSNGASKSGRPSTLYQAGIWLLAQDDYDRVSVARIAREAGCSVGAFYERFRNKDAFLDDLIRQRLPASRRN